MGGVAEGETIKIIHFQQKKVDKNSDKKGKGGYQFDSGVDMGGLRETSREEL